MLSSKNNKMIKHQRILVSVFFVFLLGSIIFVFLSEPSITGNVVSDGSWKSPTPDGDYQSPKSDEIYEAPKTGDGYIAPKIDESWTAPKDDNDFKSPEIGAGFLEPQIDSFEDPKSGEGYVKIGTYNISFNESGNKIIQTVLELPKITKININLSDEKTGNKTEDIIKNDPKKPDVKPSGVIDEASVGGWKVYGITHYYKNGGSKFIPATIAQMNLHADGTYDYAGKEGIWESADITDEDWQKWGIKND